MNKHKFSGKKPNVSGWSFVRRLAPLIEVQKIQPGLEVPRLLPRITPSQPTGVQRLTNIVEALQLAGVSAHICRATSMSSQTSLLRCA